MTDRVGAMLESFTRVEGVRGAMVVDAEAGVPVAAQLAVGVEETALAALAGALFTRTADASGAGGHGTLRVLQLEAGDGHVVVAGAGPLLVVVLTESDARLGMVRVQARRVVGELSE